MTTPSETIKTKIWEEFADSDNPFVADSCYCAGYDVFGQIFKNASWVEYLYLLFKLERPSSAEMKTFEALAIAITNPGPRDHSVRAAMNAGVSGSTHASTLMAALAVGAGQLGGAHEVALAMENWAAWGLDVSIWSDKSQGYLENASKTQDASVWPAMEHIPGFDPNSNKCAKPVIQTLNYLAQHSPGLRLPWLLKNRSQLESAIQNPLSMTGVVAAALMDLEFNPDQGEMLFLILRLPGAAAHSLEQKHYGWRKYPFFSNGLKLLDDPGPQ